MRALSRHMSSESGCFGLAIARRLLITATTFDQVLGRPVPTCGSATCVRRSNGSMTIFVCGRIRLWKDLLKTQRSVGFAVLLHLSLLCSLARVEGP